MRILFEAPLGLPALTNRLEGEGVRNWRALANVPLCCCCQVRYLGRKAREGYWDSQGRSARVGSDVKSNQGNNASRRVE